MTGRSSPLPWHPGALSFFHNRTVPGSSIKKRTNGFCSCSYIRPQNQGMDISELEFVQITIILLMMTFMLAVIVCLLGHYWLPALAFLSRLGHTQRDQDTQVVMCHHLNGSLPPFLQQQPLCRLQPTYPYLQQEIIDLPPHICLSDGKELLPYKGPCTLQLRPSDQQLELIRATVQAPPNTTVFDTDPTDMYINSKSPPAPSSNSGTINANAGMEGPPPSYSEVMVDRPDSILYMMPPKDNRSGCARSETVFHSGSSGPDRTTQATDIHS